MSKKEVIILHPFLPAIEFLEKRKKEVRDEFNQSHKTYTKDELFKHDDDMALFNWAISYLEQS